MIFDVSHFRVTPIPYLSEGNIFVPNHQKWEMSEMRKTIIFSAALMFAAGSSVFGDQDFYAPVIAGQNPTVHWKLGEGSGATRHEFRFTWSGC